MEISTSDIGLIGDLDATAIAQGIKKNEFTAAEVSACCIERARFANPKLNAIVSERFDEHTVQSDEHANEVFGGVPMFFKDEVHVKGFSTRHGSGSLPDDPEKRNEKLVDQVLSTGCVALGKSACSEFGLLPTVETDVNGATRNPHDLNFSTGGSSGGSAALVAAGVVPIAHAMDGGGSIRIPAACCGLIGLKPTSGRHDGSPTKNMPIDIVTHGIVCRSVRDSANYFAAIEKFHPNKKLPEIGLITSPSKSRLKIALITESPAGIECLPEVLAASVSAGKACEKLGHHVERITSPFQEEVKPHFIIYYAFLANMIKNFGKVVYNRKFQGDQLENFTRELGSAFPKLILQAPTSFKQLKYELTKEYDALFEQYDVLMCPTLSTPVPRIGYFDPGIGFFSMIQKLDHYINSTVVQNVTGTPAMSLPMAKCSNGLPIGIQFAGNKGKEAMLLELAFEIEQAGLLANS